MLPLEKKLHLHALKIDLFSRKKLIPLQRKIERRIKRREDKALIAARLDTAIEKELVERLKKGVVCFFYRFLCTPFWDIILINFILL